MGAGAPPLPTPVAVAGSVELDGSGGTSEAMGPEASTSELSVKKPRTPPSVAGPIPRCRMVESLRGVLRITLGGKHPSRDPESGPPEFLLAESQSLST